MGLFAHETVEGVEEGGIFADGDVDNLPFRVDDNFCRESADAIFVKDARVLRVIDVEPGKFVFSNCGAPLLFRVLTVYT